jgi:hypothetical protein
MRRINGLPWSVTLLAFLYAAGGLWSMGRFFWGFYAQDGENDYGDLFGGLFAISIGAGLLERSRFWRFALMAWLACSVAAKVTAFVVGFFIGSPDTMSRVVFQSETLWTYPAYSALGIAINLTAFGLYLALMGLQWWLVDRPEVRGLFIKSKPSAPSASP